MALRAAHSSHAYAPSPSSPVGKVLSGRSLHWRDGKLITNRKTDRRQSPRSPPHLLPDWILSFELPGMLGFGLLPGPYPGIIGVTINDPHGHVEICGKNKGWLYEQAVALLKAVAPQGIAQPIPMRMTREIEAGPTLSGPLRPGEDRVLQISWDGRRATLIHKTAMRQIGSVGEARRAWPESWKLIDEARTDARNASPLQTIPRAKRDG